MMTLVIFLMGVICGYIITEMILIQPLKKVNRELIDFIDKWEIDSWDKLSK